MRNPKLHLNGIIVTMLLAGLGCNQQTPGTTNKGGKPHPAFAPITDVTGLPRVLLIGDSISVGYTLGVRTLLKDKANVHRPPGNCGNTIMGVDHIERWLGEGEWDVIHFNWGLWDLIRKVDGRPNVAGPISSSETQYAERLERLVLRLKETGAKLIWATTTLVHEGPSARRPGDEVRYNAIAAEIMERHGVSINDLYALSASFPRVGAAPQGEPEMFVARGNVHFTPEGSKLFAEQVAKHIESALPNTNVQGSPEGAKPIAAD